MEKMFELTEDQAKEHWQKVQLIMKIRDRCEYHELSFKGDYAPTENAIFKIIITDDKFFSIYAAFNNETFDYNIKNINAFIDARILREQKQ